MNDAPKSQDVNQAGALRGEPEAAGQDETGWLIEMKFGNGLLWWSGEFDRADDDYQRARLIARMVSDAGEAVRFARREDAQRVLDGMFAAKPCPVLFRARELYSAQEHMWPAPPQAASGCSHTARSDGPITKFGIKPHSTLAQLKDDEDLRLYVQAHIEEARSAEQGATPPAPAAPPGHWDEYAMREARRLWNLPAMPKGQLVASLHCALIDAMRFAASPQPAAPEGWKLVPIEATPEMVQAYLRANDAYWHRTDALPDKLGVWRQGTPTEATAESYRAMLAAAPAAEGGAS